MLSAIKIANNTKEGKHECDDLTLRELLHPKGIRNWYDRFGKKRKLGWGIEWSNELADELHKPMRKFA